MKSVQYFNFQNSLAALNFYEKHLGATDIQRVGGDHEMFADMPEEYDIDKNFTMNASFKILGETFYCSDTMKNKKIVIETGRTGIHEPMTNINYGLFLQG